MLGTSALVVGAGLGVRHALEPDHLAAVAVLVDSDRSGLIGVSWGLGHSLPIVGLGLLVVASGVQPPAVVTALFETLVGVALVLLGGRVLWAVARGRAVGGHDHGAGRHTHLSVGDLSIGATHVHLDGDSFLVGVVHGFAGSGALVALLVATAPSTTAALGFLGAFAAASVLTMAAVSVGWGRARVGLPGRSLDVAAGLAGVGVGAAILLGWAPAVGLG